MDYFGLLVENRAKAIRWFLAGLAFMLFGTISLYVFIGVLDFKSYIATILSAELSTIARYFVNNFWVFKNKSGSLKGFIEYHIANFGAFIVWLFASNMLIETGVNYIYSGIVAVFFSTLFSFASNFFWVWKKDLKSNKNPIDL